MSCNSCMGGALWSFRRFHLQGILQGHSLGPSLGICPSNSPLKSLTFTTSQVFVTRPRGEATSVSALQCCRCTTSKHLGQRSGFVRCWIHIGVGRTHHEQWGSRSHQTDSPAATAALADRRSPAPLLLCSIDSARGPSDPLPRTRSENLPALSCGHRSPSTCAWVCSSGFFSCPKEGTSTCQNFEGVDEATKASKEVAVWNCRSVGCDPFWLARLASRFRQQVLISKRRPGPHHLRTVVVKAGAKASDLAALIAIPARPTQRPE